LRSLLPIAKHRMHAVNRATVCLFALLMLVVPIFGYAQGAEIKTAKLELNEEGYQLSAEFDLQLLAVHEDAIRKGVPVYIEMEVEVSRSRWYWLDERMVRQTRERRISYSPLTNQFRIATAGLSQNVAKFDDVKRALSTVRSWQILEKNKLRPGEKYDVSVRIRLDASQLPKPFQLNVLGAREWDIASPWTRFSIIGGEAK
jgi:Domain of unknown function (DUF4390)